MAEGRPRDDRDTTVEIARDLADLASHLSCIKGELYMDKAARLFVCVADGTPGTWRKVTVS